MGSSNLGIHYGSLVCAFLSKPTKVASTKDAHASVLSHMHKKSTG